MTTVGPVPPPLPPAPTPAATSGAPGPVGAGATPAPSAPTVTAGAVQALTAIIVNLPNTLRNRPVGSPITGTLVASDSNGNALLKTADGIVVLRGPVTAQVGSQVTLYLPEEGEAARLTIQGGASGGVSAGAAAQNSTPTSSGATAAVVQPPQPRADAPALKEGQVVTATLVQRSETQPPGTSAAAAGYARAPIGASFDARVVTLQANTGGANTGTMGINAEGNPVVTATVVGRTSAGLVAVNAGFGLLTLPAGGELQVGQRLELELIGKPGTGRPAPETFPSGQVVSATLLQRGDPALAQSSSIAQGYARAPIGTAIDARLLSVAAAAADGAAGGTVSVNSEGHPVVTATVTGRTAQGLAVVNAGFGVLSLPVPANVQTGQRLRLELLGRAGDQKVALTPGQIVTTTLIQRSDAPTAQPAPGNAVAAGYARAAIGASFDARVASVAPPPAGNASPAPSTGTMSVNAEGHPVVSASVVGRTGAGLLVVNAGFGLLTLPADGDLPQGQRIELELLGRPVAPKDAPAPAQIVTATVTQRGDPALAATNATAQAIARAPAGASIGAKLLSIAPAAEDGAPVGTIALNAQSNPVVTAQVVGRNAAGQVLVNAGFAQLAIPAGANLQPGQRVQIELVGRPGATASPAPAPSLAQGQVVTATLIQRGDTAQAAAGNGVAQGYARAAVGATFDARVLSAMPAQQGAASAMGAMGVNAEGHPVVTATVVGRTPAGLAVVNAGFGLLTVPAGGDVQAGMRLQLELLGRPASPAGLPPLPGADDLPALPADAAMLAHDWETLRRTLETLAASDPQTAAQAQGRALAVPGERMAAGLLFLIAALRLGDLSMLMGERAVRALERGGRGPMLQRLGDELGTLNRLATESAGDWRAFFLPVQQPDGPITPVRLYFRQPRKRNGQAEATTRFVVETELTRLGPLQIDGLARQQRVDLILRTREALPEQARLDIDAIVQSAAAEGHFTGSIAFQAVGRFPIDPLDEIAHPAQHGVTA